MNFKAFADDWREVVERAVAAGVKKIIVVGADWESSQRAVELAQEHPALWAAVGIHPHHAKAVTSDQLSVISKQLKELAQSPKVVAIGEIGLDYHVYKNSKYPSTPSISLGTSALRIKNIDKELQEQLFEAQMEIAQELNKPVIIHSREAGEEVLEIARGIRGVFHCFGGSKKYLKKILEAGFYVGFTGQITYVPDRASVARKVPLDRLLIETDCPYMPPFREERRSEPRDVTIIGQFLGGETEQATTANARRLFEI